MFARLASLATDAALRAAGCRRETLAVGPWRIRLSAGGPEAGEPWLLLHGMGATSATFLPLLNVLQDDCSLRLPELSALGGTRGPRAAIALDEGVDILATVIDRSWPGRAATVCGISLGGWLAVRLALARPDLVARLLLVVPGGYRDQDWSRIAGMVRVETYRDTAAIWHALFVRPPFYLRLGRPLFFLAYTSSAVRAVLATVRQADAFGDEDLRRLACPVGLIWGEEDRLFRAEVGERMQRALPRARLCRVAAAGHAVQWEKTAEFLAGVRDFRRRFPLP